MRSTIRDCQIFLFCLVFAPLFVSSQSSTDNRPIRINAGGPEIQFDDIVFESGDVYAFTTNGYTYAPDLSNYDIANTEWDELYRSETSYKDLEYNIPAQDNTCYEIRLHFAEIYFGAPGGGKGSEWGRVFDVIIEDELKINDYNIAKAEGGALHAAVHTFEVCLEEGDDEINLYFPARSDNAKISAIEILPMCNGDCLDDYPFPIELVSFEGIVESQTVVLTWMTAWEENNAYFELQRANQDQSFQAVMRIRGQGFADAVSSYSVEDQHPVKGINYYRLKQVDVNGDYTFSPIIEVTITSTLKKFQIYPNPIKKTATVAFAFDGFDANKYVNLYVRDLNGQIVHSAKITLDHMKQYKTSSEFFHQLSNGIYFIQVNDGIFSQTQRLIVL